MNLREVSLSLYSFGYSAGFIRDDRPNAAAAVVTLENLAAFAQQHGLGGVEFPLDRFFGPQALGEAEAFLSELRQRGMQVTVDLERFDVTLLRVLLPVLARNGLRVVRIKTFNFYGGNRYQQPRFREELSTFVETLRSLLPILREARITLLIENHQDLGADDLIRIIGATSADCIGINWDIGNSLAVLDTPEMFLRKAGGFIGNVHLKDYQLVRCERGFYLARCALGEGVVDFAPLLTQLRRQQGVVPMAIELGAQQARRADVFEPAYWEAYLQHPLHEHIEFFSFLSRRLQDEDGDRWKSPWERGEPGRAIVESEMRDLERSVAFLKSLEIDDG